MSDNEITPERAAMLVVAACQNEDLLMCFAQEWAGTPEHEHDYVAAKREGEWFVLFGKAIVEWATQAQRDFNEGKQ